MALPLAVIRATSCDGVNAKMIGRSNEPMRAVFDAPGVLVAPPDVLVPPPHAVMRMTAASAHPSRPRVLSMPSSSMFRGSIGIIPSVHDVPDQARRCLKSAGQRHLYRPRSRSGTHPGTPRARRAGRGAVPPADRERDERPRLLLQAEHGVLRALRLRGARHPAPHPAGDPE